MSPSNSNPSAWEKVRNLAEKKKFNGKKEWRKADIKEELRKIAKEWGEIGRMSSLLLDERKKLDEEWSKIESAKMEPETNQHTLQEDVEVIKTGKSPFSKDTEKIKREHYRRLGVGIGSGSESIVNSLINLINEKGEMEVGEAAKLLNVGEDYIESLSYELDGKNILKVKKSLFKKPILVRHRPSF